MFAVYLAGAACEGAHFAGAEREDSEAAYLQYLSRHPAGAHRPTAHARLDQLRYQAARRADRPLGYRRYLEQHPRGRYATAARERLAALALARASTAAELELVVERHLGTRQAAVAASRLPALRSLAALESDSPAVAQRFLDRHPGAPQSAIVRRHLAALRYRSLPDAPAELEAFSDEFAGTPSAKLALDRLERALERELREACDPQLLQELKTRFPSSAALGELEARWRECERHRALLALDLAALETAPEQGIRELVRWCRRSEQRCGELRALTRRAAPYRTDAKLDALRSAAYDPDLKLTWQAIEQLAWLSEAGAGQELAELAGSARLSVAWRAAPALETWLRRLGALRRRGWLSRQLGRPLRAANPDEVQRRAVLELLAGREPSGEARLVALSARPAHALSAGFLLIDQLARRGRRAPSEVRDRFLAALRRRVDWLRDSFPVELDRDSAAAGALAERELFALERAVGGLATLATTSEVERIRREAASLLASWQGKLTKASTGGPGGFTPPGGTAVKAVPSSSFEAARLPAELAEAARRHEQARAAALRALRIRRPGGELLAAEVCRAAPVAGCPADPSKKAEE